VFVAEGIMVLTELVASPFRLVEVLVSSGRADQIAPLLAGEDAPMYVASLEVLSGVAGFSVHRGVVALGERRPALDPMAAAAGAHTLLVVEGVSDHENLGALYRNAAAFGVDVVVLDPTTVDPFYRRSLRVSMGQVMHVPTARDDQWPAGLSGLRQSGWAVVALTPSVDALAIGDWVAQQEGLGTGRPIALMVGAEGPGLSAAALAAADHRVRIPMADTVDSVNVATAAAIALHRLHDARLGSDRLSDGPLADARLEDPSAG
jgi:tRNA G18 (ribose-2'-O)-methylase SpoU